MTRILGEFSLSPLRREEFLSIDELTTWLRM